METVFLLLSLSLIVCVGSVPFHKNVTIIPDYYRKELKPPTVDGRPLNISFCMTILDINSINVENMDFRMDMFLRERWQDVRLKVPDELFDDDDDDHINLPAEFSNDIWQPDLYFLNTKVVEISTITRKFSSITLYRNKTIQYSARMHAIIACQMDFLFYPMDTQICPLNIESFSYPIQKMTLDWLHEGAHMRPKLKLLQYKIGALKLEQTNSRTVEKNGNFSRLTVIFKFERRLGHHAVQTFAPSTMIVILSWFSFWLGLDSIPARVTLMVTCLLTLVTMFSAMRIDIPPVAYVKSLDIWIGMCMFMIFSAMTEFVVIKVLDEKYREEKQYALKHLQVIAWKNPAHKLKVHEPKKGFFGGRIQLHWFDSFGEEKILWEEIDRVSRIVFPIAFLIFVSFYFPLLLLRSMPTE